MRRMHQLAILMAMSLGACTTPYSPPVVVSGAQPFPGVVGLVGASQNRTVDVLLVHGMCTHDAAWAAEKIDKLANAIDQNVAPRAEPGVEAAPAFPGVQTVERVTEVAGGTVRFTALIWSPLTAKLKSQLAYDNTGEPTDCSQSGVCKPRRAKVNGALKDGLLNDCLADALVYQGQSKAEIQKQMVSALTNALGRSASEGGAASTTPLVVISESLGSKVTFDALDAMVNDRDSSERTRSVGAAAIARLALVYMGANQLPLLSLADQDIRRSPSPGDGAAPVREPDSLERVLLRSSGARRVSGDAAPALKSIALVAFTDPNDLLSYRLQASRYASLNVSITDVLVSNAPTYVGFLERPDKAHTNYMSNSEVVTLVACGWPKSPTCR